MHALAIFVSFSRCLGHYCAVSRHFRVVDDLLLWKKSLLSPNGWKRSNGNRKYRGNKDHTTVSWFNKLILSSCNLHFFLIPLGFSQKKGSPYPASCQMITVNTCGTHFVPGQTMDKGFGEERRRSDRQMCAPQMDESSARNAKKIPIDSTPLRHRSIQMQNPRGIRLPDRERYPDLHKLFPNGTLGESEMAPKWMIHKCRRWAKISIKYVIYQWMEGKARNVIFT